MTLKEISQIQGFSLKTEKAVKRGYDEKTIETIVGYGFKKERVMKSIVNGELDHINSLYQILSQNK